MTFKFMRQLLTDPVSAIGDAKRSIKEGNTVKLLVVEWMLIGLGLAVALQNFGVVSAFGAAATLATAGIVVSLFAGFLVQMVFTILGGKGNYWTGLTSLVYPKFPLAVGILISSLLFRVPFFGIIIGAFFLVMMAAMAFSILYRTVKELFKVDMITTWIGIGVVILSLVVALYLSIILLSASSPTFLNYLNMGTFSSMYPSMMMWR